jgi:hypothetical protein
MNTQTYFNPQTGHMELLPDYLLQSPNYSGDYDDNWTAEDYDQRRAERDGWTSHSWDGR